MSPVKPYLSVVAVSRNDDHGKNLKLRMQAFVTGLLEQCARHKLHAELILVDWNPPADKPGLAEALDFSAGDGHCQVRVIQVPPEIHRRFKSADALPLFQMIGKNVGVRRAQGDYVLCTNIDLLFSDELMVFLAAHRLQPGIMYRLDRYDVSEEFPYHLPLEEQFRFCEQNLIRVNSSYGNIPVKAGQPYKLPRTIQIKIWLTDHLPTFLIRWYKYLLNRISSMPVNAKENLTRFRTYNRLRRVLDFEIPHIHACGDFTLMAKQHWDALRGYAEFEMYSMHIDSVLCRAAWYSGIEQQVLYYPMCAYHIEHGGGYTPEQWQQTVDRLEAKNIGILSDKKFSEITDEIQMHRGPKVFNDENWGLILENLPEILPRKELI